MTNDETIIVSDLYIYPIKSCQAIKLEQAQVTPKGFLWDREFMVVDGQGKFFTQRQYPTLATIQVQIVEDAITLSTSNHSLNSLTFQPTLSGREIAVVIWRDRTIAIDQGDEVAAWFHKVLKLKSNQTCRLVRQSPHHIRPIDQKYAEKDEPVSFSDGYPYLITATASLAQLNQKIKDYYQDQTQSFPMNRFRPNLVVTTREPFIEGTWQLIEIGTVQFAVVKPCSRCIITTTDQLTGERNNQQEPFRTLSTFRHVRNEGIMFGENMIPKTIGIVQVGDKVTILEQRLNVAPT